MEDIVSKIKEKIEIDKERRHDMEKSISDIRLEIMYLDGTIDGMEDAILVIESGGE